MQRKSLTISAPGSIMITGEHAVVYGHPAIVCAIEQRVFVTLTARHDRMVKVTSQICDPQTMTIDEAEAIGPLRYVFGAIAIYRPSLDHGFDISIKSQINPTLGLGSSAAVTSAMLAGLMAFTSDGSSTSTDKHSIQEKLDLNLLHSQALGLVRSVQGRGSGADLAASLFGGMVAYQLPEDLVSGSADPESQGTYIDRLPEPPEMSLAYCGYKTPTAEVLARIAQRMVGKEAEFNDLYERMGHVAQQTIEAIRKGDWKAFFNRINMYQDLMVELGVSDPTLDDLISKALQSNNIHCAKISGSGLGDCIVAFGETPQNHTQAVVANHGTLVESCNDDK